MGGGRPHPPFFWTPIGFGGPQLVEKFYVLYVTETCKIWALAAAELQQQYIQT